MLPCWSRGGAEHLLDYPPDVSMVGRLRSGCTVEPLSNDHPHQRPSLFIYDHILRDGQCFLFVQPLTDDHPSDATNDRVRWDFLPRERPPRLQCISKNRGWRFNIRLQCGAYRHLSTSSNSIALNFLLFWRQRYDVTQIDVSSFQCCQRAGAQTHL